jgi:hypothetical protein
MAIFNTVQIAWLGPKATLGHYVASYTSSNQLYVPWTGFIQCANGFQSVPQNNTWAAKEGTFYEAYEANTLVPQACGSANPPGCGTNYLWAGIGGDVTVNPRGQLFDTNLIQSGFAIISYLDANLVLPMIEYAPNEPSFLQVPSGNKYATWDTFTIWGWAADANCNPNVSGAMACFWF